MATVGMSYLILQDNWPGSITPNLGKPTNGWDNTTDCCVTSPTYPLGTKIQLYNDCTRNPGNYIMCYMARADGSFTGDHSAALGDIAGPSVGSLVCTHMDTTTVDGNESYVPWYYVGGDCTATDATREGIGQVAFACGSMGSGKIADNSNDGFECGWFWVGGVCPGTATAGDLTWLYDASMETDGNVTKGRGIILMDDGTNGISFADASIGDATNVPCGWSIITDA